MGKAKRLKVSKTGRSEGLDKQISSEEFAVNKGRVKVIDLNKNLCILTRGI